MTGDVNLPPARERHRYGIKPFPDHIPAAREALLDRVELRVQGTIRCRSDDDLGRVARRISTGATTPPLFGRSQKRGGRWEASCLTGSTISGGDIAISRKGTDAWLKLKLVLNPTRTLAHLLDMHQFSEIGELSPADFFARSPDPSAVHRTLDGRDNMISDFRAFSGTFYQTLLQRVASYLAAFEAALKGRIIAELCPPDQGYEIAEQEGVLAAWNDDIHLELNWGALTVSQCEVCWERHDPTALERVHTIADGVLTSARTGTIGTHILGNGTWVERELGALSVKVPLVPDKIVLGMYAKAIDRLRFEIRYNSDLPDEVRLRLPNRPCTLTDWFDAIRKEAALRIPWENIRRLIGPPNTEGVDVLAELLAAVADVIDNAKPKRRGILRQLLLHGAITATNREGDAPSVLLERLADRGIIEHVRLVNKDAKRGRRYRLNDRYRGLKIASELG